MKTLDLINQKFNRLTVIDKARRTKDNRIIWKCQCECGNIIYALSFNLKKGTTKSCGCLTKEKLRESASKHKMSYTRIYHIWTSLKKRCSNPNDTNYKYYGGRGIKVCDEWKNDFQTFYNWSMQNGYTDKLTIDRIDVNENYCPENCRWVDMKIQNNNTRYNHKITYNGKTLNVCEWAKLYNIKYQTLISRIYHGWSIEKALTTPPRK